MGATVLYTHLKEQYQNIQKEQCIRNMMNSHLDTNVMDQAQQDELQKLCTTIAPEDTEPLSDHINGWAGSETCVEECVGGNGQLVSS